MLAKWSLAAGALFVVRSAIEFAEPAYWDPVTLLDYSAVITATLVWTAVAVVMAILARAATHRATQIFLWLSAVGWAAGALGNLLEDAFGLAWGGWPFVFGIQTGGIAMAISAVLLLVPRSPLRMAGAFLAAILIGFTFSANGGWFLSAAALAGLAIWWVRRSKSTVTTPTSR